MSPFIIIKTVQTGDLEKIWRWYQRVFAWIKPTCTLAKKREKKTTLRWLVVN